MNIEVVKQGVEFETYIRKIEDIKEAEIKFKNGYNYIVKTENIPNIIYKLLSKDYVWKKCHWDTGKAVEIDTKPHDSLEALKKNIENIFTRVYDYCEKNNYVCMMIANTPVSGYGGGHIHNSTKRLKSWDLARKLYPFQPFISLLGQNSSFEKITSLFPYSLSGTPYEYRIVFNKYIHTNRRDTRITFQDGGFSIKPDFENGMLYPDKVAITDTKGTLEVRFPSVSSLYQSLGVATFIKACLFQKGTYLQKDTTEEIDDVLIDITTKVPKYGSKTLVGIRYKKKKYIITLGKLFGLLLTTPIFKEGLDKALSELDSSTISKVLNFYSIFTKNLSMTDYYDALLKNKHILNKCIKLHELARDEFYKHREIVSRCRPYSRVSFSNAFIPTIPSELFEIEEEKVIKLKENK